MTSPQEGRTTALHGLKVVECATVVAAPLCGRMLADFGAEVIHVEPPGKGDHLRNFGFAVDGINPWWKYYARNKKLITLDISKPKGRDILFELLKDADVFIENFRPGRLDEWGIRFEDIQKFNPRLIMVRVTGYGQTGPYASQPGFGRLPAIVVSNMCSSVLRYPAASVRVADLRTKRQPISLNLVLDVR